MFRQIPAPILLLDSNPVVTDFNDNTDQMNSFGAWLHAHRKALRLYQSDVAKRSGVSTSYISTLERQQPHTVTGVPIHPDREKVIAIAKAVEGNVDEALRLCGYASIEPEETYDVMDDVVLMFRDESKLSVEEKAKILEMVRTIALGVVKERKDL